MSNYSSLKATINANVKTNGNQEITGAILNSVLIQMVNSLGAGYQYMGVATPSTAPGTPDYKVFYIAATAGTYTNFGSLVLENGEVALLVYNGTWSKQTARIPSTYVTGVVHGIYDQYVGSPTSDQLTICSSIRNIRLYGFDPTALYAPFAIWRSNGGSFHFRIAKYDGSAWNVIFYYSVPVSTFNPSDNNIVSIDATYNGLRVVATLNLPPASMDGRLAFTLSGNPCFVFSKNCFADNYDDDIATLSSRVDGLDATIAKVDSYLTELTGNELRVMTDGFILTQDDFTYNGFIYKNTGLFYTHAQYKATGYIAVRPGSTYVLKANCDTNACVGFYDENKTYINNFAQGQGVWTLTLPDNAYYIRISSNIDGSYMKMSGDSIGNLSTKSSILSRCVNNIWKTYGDMSRLENLFGDVRRWQIYEAFRQVKFIGCDPTIPRTIYLVWNTYVNNTFQIRISQFNTATNSWVAEFQYNVPASERLTDVLEITITSGTKSVEMLVDTSLLPASTGTIFNALTSTPEMIFSSDCYVSEDPGGLEERIAALEDLPANKVVRLFPNTKLPVISFEFDDVVDNDAQVVSLFDSYGAKANFAFIASDAKLSTYGKKYLQWQKNGHGILSHSINGTIFNTDNYTPATALAAFQESKNKLEKAGFVINGWVSPSSQMASEFIDGIKATYAYAFTYGSANNRESNPCTITRYSMQSHTIAEIEAFVDSCISGDNILTFYGHAADFGNTYNGEVWNIAKLTTILQYVLAKRDLGLVYFDNTDNCIKYYFDL